MSRPHSLGSHLDSSQRTTPSPSSDCVRTTFTHDTVGNRTTLSNATGTTKYAYTDRNELTQSESPTPQCRPNHHQHTAPRSHQPY